MAKSQFSFVCRFRVMNMQDREKGLGGGENTYKREGQSTSITKGA